MFSIPNTSIPFQTYDADRGAIPAAQSWFFNQPIVDGYLFCSTQPVYVRLSVGATFAEKRVLPEFFLPPGAQGVNVDYKSGGNYVWAVEVRAATATVPQFWGVLATPNDPVGGYTPASYSVDNTGQVVPTVITLAIEKDGVGVGNATILNLLTVGGVAWSPALVVGNQINLPVPPIGVQHNDAGQLNEVIIDLEDGGGVTWTITDDAANHRVKISASVARLLAYVEQTTNVTISGTTEATATQIVSAGAVVFDGTSVMIECYAPSIDSGAATYDDSFYLYDGANSIGQMTEIISPNAATDRRGPIVCKRRLTPSAGSHTYSWRASRGAVNATLHAGGGGLGNVMPAYIRITKDT